MSSSTDQTEGWPATPDGPAGAASADHAAAKSAPGVAEPADREPGAVSPAGDGKKPRRGNGFATAALALGAAGVTLVTILPGVVFGILGLRRAADRGPGLVRSWLGIGLCVMWAAAGIYLLPHLVRAADPGCTAYKGPALTAYNRVISDFNGSHETPNLAADVSRTIGALHEAAARSRDQATAQALSVLTRDLRAVLAEIHTGAVVPGPSMRALNRDAARADSACGTLHV